jgi:hypothetical protein
MEIILLSKPHEKSHLRVINILFTITDFLHTTVTISPCDMREKSLAQVLLACDA